MEVMNKPIQKTILSILLLLFGMTFLWGCSGSESPSVHEDWMDLPVVQHILLIESEKTYHSAFEALAKEGLVQMEYVSPQENMDDYITSLLKEEEYDLVVIENQDIRDTLRPLMNRDYSITYLTFGSHEPLRNEVVVRGIPNEMGLMAGYSSALMSEKAIGYVGSSNDALLSLEGGMHTGNPSVQLIKKIMNDGFTKEDLETFKTENEVSYLFVDGKETYDVEGVYSLEEFGLDQEMLIRKIYERWMEGKIEIGKPNEFGLMDEVLSVDKIPYPMSKEVLEKVKAYCNTNPVEESEGGE